MDLVQDFSKGSERLARHSNNIIFNARCKRAHIIPPSLHIRSPIRTQRGIQIAQQASRLFLNERLRLANYAKRQVEGDLKWIRIGLQRCLNEEPNLSPSVSTTSVALCKFEHVLLSPRRYMVVSTVNVYLSPPDEGKATFSKRRVYSLFCQCRVKVIFCINQILS